jgi:hypothetical protein
LTVDSSQWAVNGREMESGRWRIEIRNSRNRKSERNTQVRKSRFEEAAWPGFLWRREENSGNEETRMESNLKMKEKS